jgi:hypothetical protein
MIIYNETTHVEQSIHEAWLTWMKEIHIPEVMQTKCFTKFQIIRMLEVDETEGVTYAIQYYAENKADYNRYMELYAPAFRKSIMEIWDDKIIPFCSLMEVVH